MDIGCGEGADVVWLAERGWRVVGVDVSAVALDKARRHAGEAGVADRTEWARVDLLRAEALPGDADLVTAMYLHLPAADFDATYAAIAAAVRPGGTLLVVGHHPDDAATDLRNPQLSHLLFGPDQVARVLAAIGGWRLEVAEARRREVEKDGEPRIATDTVVVARRERD